MATRRGRVGNVCANDGFADTGIQLRPAGPPVAPVAAPAPPARLVPTYPNPAHETTRVSYELPRTCQRAELLVRAGISGQLVQQVALVPQAGGVTLDVRALPAGLYFYTLLADGVPTQTRRLLVEHH